MQAYIPHRNKKHSWRTAIFVVFMVLISAAVTYSVKAYSQNLKTVATLEKSLVDEFTSGLVLNFSIPVNQASVEKKLTLMPTQKIIMRWENSSRLIILPVESWRNQVEYRINLEGENIFFQSFTQELNFKTRSFPMIQETFPQDGQRDVSVDIEQPIKIKFNASLEDFNVNFKVNPRTSLTWQLNEEKTEVSLLATDDFSWDTQYSIAVMIKHKKQTDNEYVKTKQITFRTAKKPQLEAWESNPLLRVEQAKKFAVARIKAGKYIDIDLVHQVMVIFEDGKALDSFMISSGKKGMETPQGEFSIQNKHPRAWSRKYALFMPNWMAIVPSGEYGIHELPEWPGGYKEGADHLGKPVSHGCVRLGEDSAEKVYAWTETGTPVVIH